MIARARRSPARRANASGSPDTLPRRILLDTHAWLWWQTDDPRLGARARRAIASASEVRVSAVSAWEIAIKIPLGKLRMPAEIDIEHELERGGFLSLPIEIAHADALRRLPALHRDPFDRMLLAQAASEGLTLLTCDRQLDAYDIPTLDAES
jgi:PIN domain nuclease of toxin-antitoxin system